MESNQESEARIQANRPKARDQAFLVPFLGFVLFLPPAADIFQLDIAIFGIPFTAFYLFSVWALLILFAGLLSRRLSEENQRELQQPRDSSQFE